MAMTDTERAEINKTLARAMGWDFIPHASEIVNALEPDRGEWFTPSGKLYGDAPPDFTRDAAASRELVEWIAADDERWGRFEIELAMLISDEQGYFSKTPIRAIVTAPLETIALAAVQAIGGNAE